jgi:hypothetical protein
MWAPRWQARKADILSICYGFPLVSSAVLFALTDATVDCTRYYDRGHARRRAAAQEVSGVLKTGTPNPYPLLFARRAAAGRIPECRYALGCAGEDEVWLGAYYAAFLPNNLSNKFLDGRMGSCPPEQINSLQLARSFVAYARSRPGELKGKHR